MIAVKKKNPISISKTGERKPLTIKEQEENLKLKRNKKALQMLLEYLSGKEYTAGKWLDKIPDEEKLSDLLLILRLYGFSGKYSNDYACHLVPADSKEPGKIDDIRMDVYIQAFSQIKHHLEIEIMHTLPYISKTALCGITKLLRIEDKAKEFQDRSKIEIPEPKSLTEAKKAKKK